MMRLADSIALARQVTRNKVSKRGAILGITLSLQYQQNTSLFSRYITSLVPSKDIEKALNMIRNMAKDRFAICSSHKESTGYLRKQTDFANNVIWSNRVYF